MDRSLRLASRGMQMGMVVLAFAGVVTGEYTYIPAAIAALIISALPTLIRRDLKLVLPIELNFWIALALFLHVLGSFSGFYDNLPGWDHLTHAMSASLIAALGFVVVVAIDKYADSIYLPRTFLAVFIVMFTMAVGVIWELVEYIIDSATTSRLQYSLDDTMKDLLFDTIGGLLIASAGAYYLNHTTIDHFVETLRVPEARARVGELMERRRSKG
ncbi:MAG: hypothetical protein JSV90_01805 [Methanobacteriota archaeon]|nr:MAG: hypothetical protein JSV90_01805 [Euryarchaeota archaeon]